MKAITVDETGLFHTFETEKPEIGEKQILVQVSISGVNFMDALQYKRFPTKPGEKAFMAGIEGVGTIVRAGRSVRDLKVGQRVGWFSGGQGSFADYTAVQAGRAIPIPENIDDETAAALLLQGVTAHYLASDAYNIDPGDTALVHAAAGGVGQLLTQVVKLRGGHVIGTASTEEKRDVALAAGADHVLPYDNFSEETLSLSGHQGVEVVYDGIGAATFNASLASLKVRGTIVAYGGSSGPVPAVELSRLSMGGSLTLVAPMAVDYTRNTDELRNRMAELFGWANHGDLTVNIGGRYPVRLINDAIQALTSRNSTGKLILTH